MSVEGAGRRRRRRRSRRRLSYGGRLSITGSKDNELVGLIYRLMGLECLDCKCCRKISADFLRKVSNGSRLIYF